MCELVSDGSLQVLKLFVQLHLLVEEPAYLVVAGLDQRVELVGVFLVAFAAFQPAR